MSNIKYEEIAGGTFNMCKRTQTVVNQNTTNNANVAQTLPIEAEQHTMFKIEQNMGAIEKDIQCSYALSQLLYADMVDGINSGMALTDDVLLGTLGAINFFTNKVYADFKDVFRTYKALYNVKSVQNELQHEAKDGADCE